jgi:hypothetical protein
MIIRHRHKGRFTVVPNAIFNDDRLSLGSKGLLGYLLSLPGNWQVRHDQLQYQLGVGRKLLSKLLLELEEAGYLERDLQQARDEQNRFMPYNYIVRDIPEPVISGAPAALRTEPPRQADDGNKKEEINTNSTKPFPKPLSTGQAEPKGACQDKYSEMGERAHAAGNYPVYLGSEPHKAWCAYRGHDGMPKFVDQAVIGGKLRKIVWMPSVFPPRSSARNCSGQGAVKLWMIRRRTGGFMPHFFTQNSGNIFFKATAAEGGPKRLNRKDESNQRLCVPKNVAKFDRGVG